MAEKLKLPIPRRQLDISIDYDLSAELVSKLREMADTIESMSPEALALTYEHPEWIRQRMNCCGEGGP